MLSRQNEYAYSRHRLLVANLDVNKAVAHLASGVIVEIGGTLSHASTVAREYGLPALANVRNVTKLLKSGDRVRLDATNGFVEVLRDQAPFHTTGH